MSSNLGGGGANDRTVVECPPAPVLQVVVDAHDRFLQKEQRQYEFLGHKNNEKEMVGDEKLCTFMRGKMAMTSIPRQNTQRGVAGASC